MKSQRPLRLPRSIRAALASLRSQIRKYIILDGFRAGLVWLGVTFWLIFAFDYLPVLFGFDELPKSARAILLGMVGLVTAWILFRLIFNRLFVRLKDRNMALLLERKFPEFDESLLTTVEAARSGKDPSVDETMLEKTATHAQETLNRINTEDVINWTSLYRGLMWTGLVVLSILVFAFARPADFRLAGHRLYALGDQTWPRQSNIEIVGIKVKRDNLIEGIEEIGHVIPPRNDEFRVAKGSSLTLMVRAEAPDAIKNNKRRLPKTCTMYYRTAEGNRGQQTLKRIGAAREGYQLYSIDEQPLQGILSDITFSIRGRDHRVGPFTIKAVDSPAVVETELDCVFPDYMVDNESMRWTPRTIIWTGHSQLPQGTRVNIQSKANKPLKKVYAYDITTRQMNVIKPQGDKFEFPIERIVDPQILQFYLCDTDGIVSEQPHSITIQPIEDQPPIIQTILDGIGTAVTPDARIPIAGKIADDYGVARQWVSVFTPVTGPIVEEFDAVDGKIETEIDFKEKRQRSREQISLPTGEDSQIELLVQGEDWCTLRGDAPNVGLGDRYVLDVVTPGELLRILERLEVGQRRRLEQVYTEVSDVRGYLVRSKSSRHDSLLIRQPGEDSIQPGDVGQVDPIRRDEMRLLFAQRGLLQIDKSIQEILGIAIEFESIRKQLINNRVDSKDRKERLSRQIVAPLRLIANESMQQLKELITNQETTLRELQKNATDRSISETADQQTIVSIEQIDLVLNELDQVLAILVKYETQNELLDIVRQMIKLQKELNDRTTRENKRRAFDRLLDLD